MTQKIKVRGMGEIDAAEGAALAQFVGGMVLAADESAMKVTSEITPEGDSALAFQTLDAIEADLARLHSAESVEEMRRQMVRILDMNARLATIAARNFESMPDEAVRVIYNDLIQMHGLPPST